MAKTLLDLIACRLEKETGFSRLVARGTVRAGLQAAGLDPVEVIPQHMKVMIEKVLPAELTSCGVEDTASVCRGLLNELATAESRMGKHTQSSPDDFFNRLNQR